MNRNDIIWYTTKRVANKYNSQRLILEEKALCFQGGKKIVGANGNLK